MSMRLSDCRVCLNPLTGENFRFHHDRQNNLPHFVHPICFAQWLRVCQRVGLPTRCPSCLGFVNQIFRESPSSADLIAQTVEQFVHSLLPPEGPIPEHLKSWGQNLNAAICEDDWSSLKSLLSSAKMNSFRSLRPKWFDRCLGTAFEKAVSLNQLDILELLLKTTLISRFSLKRGLCLALNSSFFTIADTIFEYILSELEDPSSILFPFLREKPTIALYLLQEAVISKRSLNILFAAISRLGHVDFLELFFEKRLEIEDEVLNQALAAARANQQEEVAAYLSEKLVSASF